MGKPRPKQTKRLRDRMHIVEGLAAAQARWPEVAKLAFETETPGSFVDGLVDLLDVSQIQATAISDMQLRRLGRLQRDVITQDLAELRHELTEAGNELPD